MLGCESQFSYMEEEELLMLKETLETLILLHSADLKPLGVTHLQVDCMQEFYKTLLKEVNPLLNK